MVKKKLLLADDDFDDRTFFHEFFEDRNEFELMPMAENGLEVIDLLDSIKNTRELPDLIILDHNMPRMSGKQTLEFLKSNSRYSAIPVIIYSTYSDSQLVEECTLSGAILVATKPTTYQDYRQMISRFLNTIAA